MNNQHAGLSQALAEQRITQRHEQAAHARLLRQARAAIHAEASRQPAQDAVPGRRVRLLVCSAATLLAAAALVRQRIADLHAEAARQRLARSVPVRPANRATTLRQLVTGGRGCRRAHRGRTGPVRPVSRRPGP